MVDESSVHLRHQAHPIGVRRVGDHRGSHRRSPRAELLPPHGACANDRRAFHGHAVYLLGVTEHTLQDMHFARFYHHTDLPPHRLSVTEHTLQHMVFCRSAFFARVYHHTERGLMSDVRFRYTLYVFFCYAPM